jgi:hypothetical protein
MVNWWVDLTMTNAIKFSPGFNSTGFANGVLDPFEEALSFQLCRENVECTHLMNLTVE